MKNYKKYLIVGIVLLSGFLGSCRKNILNLQPTTIVTDQQIWTDPHLVTGLLANFYGRLGSEYTDATNYIDMCDFDEAMYSGQSNSGNEAHNALINYANNRQFLYDYTLIRDLNNAIVNVDLYGAATLDAGTRTQFKSEIRWLRAFQYFQMVIREGGVPLVTTPLNYDYSGNVGPLRQPRATEAATYDFIASEMDAIIPTIGNSTTKAADNSRANMYTCYALKSRAMLYAASIAKYNALNTPSITLPGGEVGIPAASANAYYAKSLAASLAVINSGLFQLYNKDPNLGENYYEAIRNKGGNLEAILVRDYLTSKAKTHLFAYDNIPRGLMEDNLSSSQTTPTLGMVESYDYLDGTPGTIKIRTADNSDFIYYTNPSDAFANHDARLYGTVIYPNAPFKGSIVQIQAGVMVWNAATSTYTTVEGANLASTYTDGGILTSINGPHRTINQVSNTGFYIRKWVDNGAGTSTRGIASDVWWIWFRLSEMYLNAAEASVETGDLAGAATYANFVRARAGFTGTGLYTAATPNLRDRIRNDFKCEFAFEDHRWWDLKRWRIADQLFNGGSINGQTVTPATTNPDAVAYALYPYRVIRPGDPTRDGKYVFVKIIAPRFKNPRFFQLFNYYNIITQSIINSNPLIKQNPFF